MKNALKIAVFTVAVTMFYWYVGQQVPQKETYPPQSLEIRPNLTTEEMVEIGEEIVSGKGTCLGCHTIGSDQAGRFPDLGGVGAVAAGRKEGLSDVEYLAESIYDPNIYIVEGFNPGMPPVNKPPINLSDQEILTVIAYLQSLGSTPTVTMQTKLKYAGQGAPALSTPGLSPEASGSKKAGTAGSDEPDGESLSKKYLCTTCHSIDTPIKQVGPSLYDVGSRLSRALLYEAILNPEATIVQGYPAGVMSATLNATGFYNTVSAEELKAIVEYLASKKGGR